MSVKINIRRLRKNYIDDRRGTSTVEFVVGMPLLLLAMVFVFEFSSMFWAHHIAVNNVRSAVRFLSRAPLQEPYLSDAQNIAKTGNPNDSTGYYDWMAGVVVDINETYDTFSAADFRTSGQIIRIEAQVPFALNTFSMLNVFSGGSLGNSLTMSIVEEARFIGE